MLIKVLNGCGVNNRFWVFSSAVTNVEFTLRVTDTYTGEVKEYVNQSGTTAPAVTDTDALGGCAAIGPPRIEFTSDRSLALRAIGDKATLQVNVFGAAGHLLPDATVTWTSSDPSLVEVTPSGPSSAVVRAAGNPPASVVIRATYRDVEADALVLLATPAPTTVLISSADVIAQTADTLTLRATAQTRAVQPGQIFASGDRSGVLARVASILGADNQSVIFSVTPASLVEAFTQLTIGVSGQSTRLTGSFHLPRGSDRAATEFVVDGLVQEEPLVSLREVKCSVDGSRSPAITLEGAEISFDVTVEPYLRTNVQPDNILFHLGEITTFSLGAVGEIRVNISTGSITVGTHLEGKLECSLELTTGSLPAFAYGPFTATLDVTPKLGVEGTATFDSPSLRLKGPSGSLGGRINAGVRYTKGLGWEAIREKSWDGHLEPPSLDGSNGGFSSNADGFASLDFGVGVFLGNPASFWSKRLLNARFFDLKGYGYFTANLPLPIDFRKPSYKGPDWEAGIGLKGDLKAEIAQGVLHDLLERVGIKTSFGGPVELFNLPLPLVHSPTAIMAAAPTTHPDVGHHDSVQFSIAPSGEVSRGSVEFLASGLGGGSRLSSIATGRVEGLSGGALWTPSAGDVGEHEVYGRVWNVDAISQALPYATTNHVNINVSNSGPGEPTKPGPFSLSGNSTCSGAVSAVSLSWSDSARATTVVVYRDGSVVSGNLPSRQHAFIDSSNVSTGQTYSYFAQASNTSDSTDSNTITVVVPRSGCGGGGETSASVSGVSPNPVPGLDDSQTLTVFGNNFVSGATATLRDLTNGGTFPKSVNFTNSGQLSLSANFTNRTANWSVSVTNSGASESNQFQFQVQATGTATASVSGVSPNPVPGLDGSQTLTVFGNNFVSGATATLRDLTNGGTFPKSVNFANSGQLSLSANFTNRTATWSVSVTNPSASESNQFQFQAQATGPVTASVSGVSPNPVPGLNGSQTLTVFGNNFVSGATATLRDLTHGGTFPKSVNFTNSGQLSLNANFTNTTATWSVSVTNPGTSESNQFQFQVQATGPVTASVSGVSPNPVPGLDGSQTLTVFGNNFVSGATATLRDLTNGGTFPKSVNFANSGQLSLSANFTNHTATWSVSVTNPGTSESNQFQFQVQATGPVTASVSGVSPNPVPGLDGSQALTVFGNNFVSGATATLRDLTHGGTFPKSVNFTNSGQLSLNANFTNTTATWSVSVTNPGASESNQFQFQVQHQ
ncbi:MAG TPA: hypothetical protein VHQ90_25880 [Thermoanaerobaculia bacterium]|nr:hypothetical protein [Thermoanaerobaculia bacterium]